MIVLDATTEKIQGVLGVAATANQPQFFASYRDINLTAKTYVPGNNQGTFNDTTDVDIVGTPGASTQRIIDFISVYNAGTASVTVTIKLDISGSETILHRAVLQPYEKLL